VLLDRHGFSTHLDMVLSGGRSGSVDRGRTDVEREHFEATMAVEAMERAGQATPDLDHLHGERARLLEQITEHLAVDPADRVVELLRAHRPVDRASQADLAHALAEVGIRPSGISLEDAALSFVDLHPLPDEDDDEPVDQEDPDTTSERERQGERTAVEARSVAIEHDLEQAQAEVDRTAEALHMSQRSVGAFETELSERADEDATRLRRFAAVEELRAQIEAVSSTLRKAEEAARAAISDVDAKVAAAEAGFDEASTDLSDLARQARQLAEELPIALRPEGEVLQSLPELCSRLREHADALQPELDSAEVELAAASQRMAKANEAAAAVGTDGGGPLADDLLEAGQSILDRSDCDTVLVLDEAFVGADVETRRELLELVHAASSDRQIVLLTADADVLGWAIELPAEEATAMPGDALLNRLRRPEAPDEPAGPVSAPGPAPVPEPAMAPAAPTPTHVDITTPTPAPAPPVAFEPAAALEPLPEPEPTPEPAKAARRWAGQR
jgi:hypothetical protein